FLVRWSEIDDRRTNSSADERNDGSLWLVRHRVPSRNARDRPQNDGDDVGGNAASAPLLQSWLCPPSRHPTKRYRGQMVVSVHRHQRMRGRNRTRFCATATAGSSVQYA